MELIKVLHFNSKQADLYNNKKITYFFKNPIILKDKHLLKTGSLNFLNKGQIINFVDETNLGVIFNSNYGFDLASTEGIWHYKIPNTDLTIIIEIFNPIFSTRAARINDVIWGGGFNDPNVIFAATSANDFIEIPNGDVIRPSDGTIGWYKSSSSGNLKIRINTIQQIEGESKKKIKIYIENLIFSNVKYSSSCNVFNPIFDLITYDNKIINSSLYKLTLEPQIINNISFIIEDENGEAIKLQGEDKSIINFTLLLKKNI